MGNGLDGHRALCFANHHGEVLWRKARQVKYSKIPGTMVSIVTISMVLTACAGVAFSKAGEDDANAACKALSSMQGDDVSIDQGLQALARAEVLSARAASENDDYELLASAMSALSESMFVGSEALAQSAWANAARLCNDL